MSKSLGDQLSKRSKKEKKSQLDDEDIMFEETSGTSPSEKKVKKDKKEKKSVKSDGSDYKKDKSDRKSKSDSATKKSRKRNRSSSDPEIQEEEPKRTVRNDSPEEHNDPNEKPELFIGNLVFNTTEEDVRALFPDNNLTRVHLIKNGSCAFVAFETMKEAREGLSLNQTELNGRTVHCNMASDKPAPRAGGPSPRAEGRPTGNRDDRDRTIFCGGLPFGTTQDDVRALFSEKHSVERVHLIQNGGAAFIAYSSVDDAQANLCWNGTKYQGRALRVNMANEKPSR